MVLAKLTASSSDQTTIGIKFSYWKATSLIFLINQFLLESSLLSICVTTMAKLVYKLMAISNYTWILLIESNIDITRIVKSGWLYKNPLN